MAALLEETNLDIGLKMSDSSPNELKTPESSPFMLKSDAAFGSRVGDVFGNLDDDGDDLIKADPQDDFGMGLGTEHTDVSLTKIQKPPSQKQSFKRPHNPAPRSRTCPDYKLNPGKWTYYNLEDVSADSMSEKSNTAAAEHFLDSIDSERSSKKQKTDPDNTKPDPDIEMADTPTKVIFRKPQVKDEISDVRCNLISGAGKGVLVMPEYVVGQKSTPRKSRPSKFVSSSSQSSATVTLSHVIDEDYDESDDSSDSDSSLTAKPTRTVFSGCEKEQKDEGQTNGS
ncbi:hypothetical protein LSH36_337g05074 [Paralvinella palmiformis]|uniref:U5 small nuclear ribonucleoprotein TSSC4 n=1 Tax=Paralvinella palmiformis TaxID=53620 RepID=A0AAD9N1Q3_9ANNE|nr:hypothetical protein LSH36_337g05074 [Paralvinella palmiformis]